MKTMSAFWNIAARKKTCADSDDGKKRAEKKNRTEKKCSARELCLAAVFVILFGLILEFAFLFPALRAKGGENHGRQETELSEISQEGFELTEDGLRLKGESGFLHIPLDGSYVGKFVYSYEYDGLLNVSVRIGVRNVYGELRERDAVTLEDRNSRVLDTSWIPVGAKADYVEIYVSRDGLREEGLSYIDFDSMPLTFTEFRTEAAAGLNVRRLCFFWCLGLFLVMIFVFRDIFARRIEVGFLVISLTVGTLLSLSLPANKVSWDEEVHFSQAFWMANYRNPVPVSPAILQEFSAGIDTWPYNQPGSREEVEALNDYLDREGNYRSGEHTWSVDLNKTTMTGYVGQALMIKLGELAGLPFSVIFRMGRLGNLWLYCIVLYFAIKKTPVGKGIMAFIGLMPEPLMLAGVYSYDPAVTAFLYLSFACILEAVLDEKKQITWKDFIVIALSFVWGCRIKAVYAPLILLGLLIPKKRFRNEREYLIMKAAFVAVAVLMIVSFALPVLLAPRDIGDVRGENTSEKGQMAYILGQPAAYAWVLIKNMVRTIPSYILGENALGLLGHQGQVSFPWLIYAGSTAVILTDGRSACGRCLDRWQKIFVFILCAGAAVLVWTSMYIAFTTPGNTYIDGVQGRYYIPFLFLLWLVFNPPGISVKLGEREYNAAVLALGGGILLAAYYMDIFQKFCI